MTKKAKDSLMKVAQRFLKNHYQKKGVFTLRWWRDEYYIWDETKYVVVPESELRAMVLEWLEEHITAATPRKARDIAKCLESLCRVPSKVDIPAYLGDIQTETKNWITMQDGIVDLGALLDGKEEVSYSHTPNWFCTTALPYRFDQSADCPNWLAFLNDVFDGDSKRIDLLQEWFGYCLTNETRHQVIMLLHGPPRAGKGITLRILRRFVGAPNCVDPRLSNLGTMFGLQSLIGKTVALFPDAHLGRGEKATSVLEILKSISGEDAIEVNRKFLRPISCRLNVRFILAVNELPKFGDNSRSLSERLLVLLYENTYVGREDRYLEEKLAKEVPGIFMWAVRGLKRLRKEGRFTIPANSKAIIQEFSRLSSPVHAFVEDHCIVSSDARVKASDLYNSYKKWSEENNHRPVCRERFGAQLRSLIPRLGQTQPRESVSLR